MRITIIFIFSSIVFFSCKKDSESVTPNLNYNYAGLAVGNYIIYDVDSVFYNDFDGTINSFSFQRKEVIESGFIDLEGDVAYKIHRFKKVVDSLGWVLTDVWSSKLTTTTYEKVEENARFVKLLFPIRANKIWNGNTKNNQQSMEYEYTTVHTPAIIGGIFLDSVSTVLQFENINNIEEEIKKEKFATNIGLVYKRSVLVHKGYNSITKLWERDAGTDVTMTLSSYGKIP
jgi:hypothetical protein